MGGMKRRRSLSPGTPRKSTKVFSSIPYEDEDLESILEQIRQQEESEALARKLQREFDDSQAAETIDLTHKYDTSASHNDTIEAPAHEDDEAMAQRLAREWEQSDVVEIPSKQMPLASGSKSNDDFTPMGSKAPQPSYPTRSDSSSSDVLPVFDQNNPEEELLGHRDIFIRSRQCTKCGEAVTSPRGVVVFSVTCPPPTLLARLHAVCTACRQSHCRGCFRPLTCPRNCKGKHCEVANCCAEVRAIGLFEALGGFDRQYIGEQLSFSNDTKKAAKRRSGVKTVGPGGTGYSTESRGNYHPNHSRHGAEHSLEDLQAAETSQAVAARWDDIIVRAFETITYLLPSPYSDTAAPYDFLPHLSIRSLISVSFLPELLRGLLINDSVTDWTKRSNVYNAMLGLLRRMADSELSVGVLIGERWEKKKSVGLEDWMWGDGTIEWELRPGTEEIVRAPPLYDYFKKLTKQCETFLTGASHLLGEGDDQEVEEMTVRATSLCGDMISAQQDMQRALAVITRGKATAKDPSLQGKGKNRDLNVELEKRYCIACEELAFKHVTLSSGSSTGGLVYTTYHYAEDVRQTANSARQPAKRLHLIKEISSLATSLPPGVWVRVDEVRNDVIKIMIAGPEGTPYAGGLFEFHCFLPLEYPDISPKVNLHTTAGGQVRFNPNLYNCGKVCLSLLGTWPGRPEEQWSSKSTLLQVLVSIQSMILVDAPFFNEPGFGQAKLSDPRSITYNKNIALQTVRWAMIDWMKEEHRDGIWADVIATHFSIRKEKIQQCIQNWAACDPRFQAYHNASMAVAGTHSTGDQYYPQPHGGAKFHRAPSQPKAGEPQKLNLLEEFDRGCTVIDGWLKA